MADNTTLDPGAGGDSIATDDVGGFHYQRTKLTDGTADSSTTINSGNGTHTNALRVTLASDSTGVITAKPSIGAGTVTTVADNAASATLITAAARSWLMITNTSSARLFVRLEAAAATTTTGHSFSLAQHESWEGAYVGEARGIWATDPNDGAAQITSFA